MIGLTPHLLACKDFIRSTVKTQGFPPSQSEIMRAVGLKSKSGVNRLINELVERGHLRRWPRQARALEVIDEPDGCPHCGYEQGSVACRDAAAEMIVTYSQSTTSPAGNFSLAPSPGEGSHQRSGGDR